MVFYLKIQTAYQPAYHFVLCGKIGSCLDLVYSPFIFQLSCLLINQRKRGMFNCMGQLKYNTQDKTGYAGKNQKADQPGSETNHIDRQTNKKKSMKQFKSPESKVVGNRHLLKRDIANFIPEIFFII